MRSIERALGYVVKHYYTIVFLLTKNNQYKGNCYDIQNFSS
jgi:hypothetical protein